MLRIGFIALALVAASAAAGCGSSSSSSSTQAATIRAPSTTTAATFTQTSTQPVTPTTTSVGPPAHPPTTPTPSVGGEAPGSYSHADDAGFCSSHHCIANFPNGHGYIVKCADGEWSHSGGLRGACSDHGGEA